MRSRRTGVITAVVAALALVGVIPTAAVATTSVASLQMIGTKLVYTAYQGFANDVDVSPDGLGGIEVTDAAGPIDLLGGNCVPSPTVPHPNKVTCPAAGLTTMQLSGGDLDDVLYVRDPMSVTLHGGTGDDELYGSIGDDLLDGGPGDDLLFGGPGDDTLAGAGGADELIGDHGTDTVTYAAYAVGVTADADGQTGDDGAPGEGDSISDNVEHLTGGAGADTLGGNDRANTLRGNGGPDHLSGFLGADTLYGDAGVDLLDGGGRPGGYESDTCSPGADGATLRNCEVVRR